MPTNDPAKIKAINRRYYERGGAARIRAKTTEYRKRNHAYIRSAKDVPCTDCGERYPYYVMDFDHLRDKARNVGTMAQRAVSLATLQLELDKCEVVCSNCHRERTQSRLSS